MNSQKKFVFQKSLFFALIQVFLLLTVACQTAKTSINSKPSAAQVFEINAKGEREKLLGVTPLSLDKKLYGIEVSKNGFEVSKIYLPYGEGAAQSLQVTLTVLSNDWFDKHMFSAQNQTLSKTIGELFELQNLVKIKKFDEAEKFISKNDAKYDAVSVYQIIVGHNYYFKKDIAKAKQRYTKALELDSKNIEASQMLKLLNTNTLAP